MYAIVNIAGQQMKVAKDQQVYVNRLPNKAGDKVTFDEVLLVDDNGKVNVGAPAVSGASVSAEVIEHLKGDKVIVFKKKRRKGYQTRNGHRQMLTKIAIAGISLDGAKKAAKAEEKPKAETKPKAEEKPKAEAKSTAKASKADDLKMIEGVGPKIADLLSDAGIKSFKDLAKASVDQLNEILSDEGGTYASHNPETWPEQAQLAADGKFDELKEWQDKLEGGVDK